MATNSFRVKALKKKMSGSVLEKAEDVLFEDLEYSERQTRIKPFDYPGFITFGTFLGVFCMLAMLGRDTDAYFLASAVRSLVGVEGDGHEGSFMAIDTPTKYHEWLEYHLFSGLGNVSYRLPKNDSINTVPKTHTFPDAAFVQLSLCLFPAH